MLEGLSPELSEKALYLRSRHKTWADALTDAHGVFDKAQKLRDIQAEEGFDTESLTHHDRVFANGEIEQRAMINQAQLHYDANMWRSQEHYRQNEAAYQEQAVKDLPDGVDTSFGQAQESAQPTPEPK